MKTIFREVTRSGERVYLLLAAAFAVLGALCVAAMYAFGIQGDPASSLIGTASFFGIFAAVALTAVGLRAGWRLLGGKRGNLAFFTGLGLLVDAGLSELALVIGNTSGSFFLNQIGPATGPDDGLFWGFLAIFMGGAGAVVLIGDAIWAAVRGAQHRSRPPVTA